MKNEDVTVAPTSNVMEALQGKIAGMDIVKSSGQVGEDVSILLRGSLFLFMVVMNRYSLLMVFLGVIAR